MAKTITSRGVSQPSAKLPVAAPGIVVEEIPYWQTCKGVDYTHKLSRVTPEYASELRNMWIRDEFIVGRCGTGPLGGTITDSILGHVNFITVDGVSTMLRFRVDTLERWDGSAWIIIFMKPLVTLDDRYTWTTFGNCLIFSDGVHGMWQYDAETGICTLIEGAPAARHLTTFGGRVIASGVIVDGNSEPGWIVWCVKNNSHDWTGIGSGYEPLLSTPGGDVDAQRGVQPITDYTAIVLRSNSTWTMTQTGDVESPFRFSRISPGMGTDAPYSFVGVPSATVGLMKDDVYVVSEGHTESIGAPIRRRLLENKDWMPWARGAYNPDEREYVMLLNNIEYRYSFRFQAWTTTEMPLLPHWVEWGGKGFTGLTIDSALGTIDTPLPSDGTIDSEVGPLVSRGMIYSSYTRTIEEVVGLFTDTDESDPLVPFDSPMTLATGLLQVGTPLEETEITEVQFEYELIDYFGSVNANVEYSIDGGASWQGYGAAIMAPTVYHGARIFAVRKSLVGHNIMLRLRTAHLIDINILAMWVLVTRAKKVAY